MCAGRMCWTRLWSGRAGLTASSMSGRPTLKAALKCSRYVQERSHLISSLCVLSAKTHALYDAYHIACGCLALMYSLPSWTLPAIGILQGTASRFLGKQAKHSKEV